MEKQHNELLAAKEHELTARINQAVVSLDRLVLVSYSMVSSMYF